MLQKQIKMHENAACQSCSSALIHPKVSGCCTVLLLSWLRYLMVSDFDASHLMFCNSMIPSLKFLEVLQTSKIEGQLSSAQGILSSKTENHRKPTEHQISIALRRILLPGT